MKNKNGGVVVLDPETRERLCSLMADFPGGMALLLSRMNVARGTLESAASGAAVRRGSALLIKNGVQVAERHRLASQIACGADWNSPQDRTRRPRAQFSTVPSKAELELIRSAVGSKGMAAVSRSSGVSPGAIARLLTGAARVRRASINAIQWAVSTQDALATGAVE